MLLYIDPGTGSMLFTILIGLLGAGVYAARGLYMKIRFMLSSGKVDMAGSRVSPIVIYSDDKRYWNVFKPICDELERRGQQAVYMTSSPDDSALDTKYNNISCQFIGEGNRAFAKLNIMQADLLLSTTPGLDVYQWKRSKGIKYYVHITHAPSDIAMYRMFGIDYYDALLLSGDYQVQQVRKLEELRKLPPKELTIVGIPYMDEMKKRLESGTVEKSHNTTVLLAPSWGESAILKRFGSRIIDALLDTGYHIIIRPHPQSFKSESEMINDLMSRYSNDERLEWNRDSDNFEVLNRSDILISDFSGVIFDFSLVFDKPIIYTDVQYDKSPYDACWLKEELWTFEVLPKIGAKLDEKSLGDLRNMIDDCLNNNKYKEARDSARMETWMYEGEGAVRTVDYLINKLNAL